MNRKFWYLMGLFMMLLLSACTSGNNGQVVTPVGPLTGDSVNIVEHPTATPEITISQQQSTPSPTTTTVSRTITSSTPPPYIPGSGLGPAPYGPPPAPTAEEIHLTQQLFALINSDRAARGLYPFVWNVTLAGGARLHSWNMFHCGFSHTCPDGENQCTRIGNEGFWGYTDCGECIGLAGPSAPPSPWSHIYTVQESMINEPPSGWHRIHLTSTTLHSIGVGIYVDPYGWAWFTEDLVS